MLVVVHPDGPTGPYRPSAKVPMLRLETGNASLRKAFRENNKQPLQLGFDYADLGTFHPLGNFASMLNSLMGKHRPLPLCLRVPMQDRIKADINRRSRPIKKFLDEVVRVTTARKIGMHEVTGVLNFSQPHTRAYEMLERIRWILNNEGNKSKRKSGYRKQA
ncbi:hypothetical protein Tco_0153645 [Tanacetum coccineum]